MARRFGVLVAIVAAVAALGSSPALACGLFDVTAGAALDGNYGLEVQFDGSDLSPCYVFDATPDAETTMRVLFKMEAESGVTANLGYGHDLYRATSPSGSAVQMKLRYLNAFGGTPYVQVQARKDDGTWSYPLLGIAPTRHGWMIEWQAASAAGANDGVLRLWKRNADGSYTCLKEGTGIDNDTWNVGGQYMGAMGAIGADMVGTFNIDTFESYRTLSASSPVCQQSFPE